MHIRRYGLDNRNFTSLLLLLQHPYPQQGNQGLFHHNLSESQSQMSVHIHKYGLDNRNFTSLLLLLRHLYLQQGHQGLFHHNLSESQSRMPVHIHSYGFHNRNFTSLLLLLQHPYPQHGNQGLFHQNLSESQCPCTCTLISPPTRLILQYLPSCGMLYILQSWRGSIQDGIYFFPLISKLRPSDQWPANFTSPQIILFSPHGCLYGDP